MKKLAYSLLFLSFGSFAQLQPGYHPEQGYAYEDFGSSTEYPNLRWSNLGSHAYTIDSINRSPAFSKCFHIESSYSYNLERVVDTKTGFLNVNQAYGSYLPVILDFGANTNGKKNILDLSKSNAFLSFQLKNTSDSMLTIWFYVMDSTGNKINSVGTHTGNQDYLDFTWYDLKPGEYLTKVIDFNKDGYESLFDKSNCGSGFILGRSELFNLKLVSGIGLAVMNRRQNTNDAYKSFSLKNTGIQLYGLSIGAPSIVNGIEKVKSNQTISFYPNPTSDKITFSERLDNIVLKDMAGNIALQAESASELNLSTLPKGVYLLSSSNLTKPNKIIIN